MFDKTFQTAFVCLRCQSRILRQQSTCSSTVRIRRPKPTARWQSTAAARVEEENDDIEDRVQEDDSLDAIHNSAASVYLGPTGRREVSDQYQGAYRKFHPDRVAGLGLSSLGKPAEVLVLQPRDRYIPRTPTEEDGQKDPRILEALQAETAPLDPEQVKLNIEQIKEPFGDGSRILDESEWKKLRNNLVKGFTHVQLLDYIRHMEASKEPSSMQVGALADAASSILLSSKLSSKVSEKPDLKRAGRNRIKKRAAISIIKDVWGFLLAGDKEIAEHIPSGMVTMSRSHIGALKAQNAHAFKKVSESLRVKIDVFQEKSKIVIYGSTDAVQEARKVLDSMKCQIKSMTIDLGWKSNLLPGLRDTGYEQKLLEELGRNRPLYIEKKNFHKAASSVRVFYHESEQEEAEAARRDILLAGRGIGPRSSMSIWPQLNQQSTWLVPYSSLQALPWWERLSTWGRWSYLREAEPNALNGSPGQEAPSSALSMEISRWLHNTNTNTNATLKSDPFTLQHTALFGQAVFRRDIKQQLQSVMKEQQMKVTSIDRRNIQHPRYISSTSSPKMVTDVPLLAQSLALCKPWSPRMRDSNDSRPRSMSTGQFTHRLLLLPAVAEPHSPSLQVYLTGEDARLGLRQPLRIRSISAILEEHSHVLLLPDLSVDVAFRSQTLYHMYTANRRKNPKHDQFFGQFLHYLNQAQGQEFPRFAASVMLSLPRDLGVLHKRLNLAPALVPKEIGMPPKNTDNALPVPSLSPKLPRKVGATEYILAASESIDVASYSPSAAKNLCLNHIQFTGPDGIQSRQELRLDERPYPDTLASSTPFLQLFDSAYAVASWLGAFRHVKRQP